MTTARLILLFARSPSDERKHKPFGIASDGRRVEAVHRALFERTLAAAGAVESADVRVVSTGELDEVRALASGRVDAARLQVKRQIEGGFGERIAHAMAGAFAGGYRQVVLVGGDAPELSAERIEEAFARLDAAGERKAAVLGPALDGGYYLLGLSADVEVFTTVSLATSRAGAETVQALTERGFTVDTLAPLDDVDNLSGVIALSARLRAIPAEAALRALLLSLLTPVERPTMPAATRPANAHLRPVTARAPPLFG